MLGAEPDQPAAGLDDDELAAVAGLGGEAGVRLHVGEHGPRRCPPDPGAVLPEPAGVRVVEDLQAGIGAAQRAGAVVVAELRSQLASTNGVTELHWVTT